MLKHPQHSSCPSAQVHPSILSSIDFFLFISQSIQASTLPAFLPIYPTHLSFQAASSFPVISSFHLPICHLFQEPRMLYIELPIHPLFKASIALLAFLFFHPFLSISFHPSIHVTITGEHLFIDLFNYYPFFSVHTSPASVNPCTFPSIYLSVHSCFHLSIK